jgi:DNA repair protein SbcD/Mre11
VREAGIPVILIKGNHDAANRITKDLRLPDNVEILSHTRPQTANSRKLHDLGVAVHGRSFARAAEHENLAREYPSRKKGMFNIGLLHTSLSGAEGHEPYAPCTLDELRQKEYDYWALGHVHNRSVRCDEPHVVFAGNLQGRHIHESGAKGCYVVTVEDGAPPELEFHPLDVFRWESCLVSASDIPRPEELLDLFAGQLEQLMAPHDGMPLAVRVIVEGRSRVHEQLGSDRVRWTNELRATALDVSGGNAWIEKIRFRTSPFRDIDDMILSEGPLAELGRCLEELRRDPKQLLELVGEFEDLRRKLPEELLRGTDALGLDEPSGLQSLLDDVQPMLMKRFEEGRRP